MSLNLFDLVKDQLTEGVIGKISSVIGSNSSSTQSALTSFLPTLLSQIVDKGSTVSGSVNLLEMIKDKGLGSGTLDNLSSTLDSADATSSFMKTGRNLVSSLFGKNESSALDKLSSLSGLAPKSSSGLMSMLAPIAMSTISKIAKKDNLDAGGLHNLLSGQKSLLQGLLPVGMGTALAFAGTENNESVKSTATVHANNEDSSSGGIGGWWKWLLGLLLLLLLAWLLMRGCSGDKPGTALNGSDTERTSMDARDGTFTMDQHGNLLKDGVILQNAGNFFRDAAGNIVDGSGKIIVRAGEYGDQLLAKLSASKGRATSDGLDARDGNYTIDKLGNLVKDGVVLQNAGNFFRDAAGNIVDGTGKIIARAGAYGNHLLAKLPASKGGVTSIKSEAANENPFTKDVKGNLVDANGKIVYKVGDFTEKDGYYVDKDGKKIGFFGIIGGAIGDVANATADAFSKVFGGLFSKKEKVGTTHSLTRVQFDPESHRITYFSKPEVEGMVQALNQYPDAKINVQVYTNDGKDSKENNELTDLRAKVLHDMLVTLGVKDSQISHKGMGDSNAAKASADKVDILVEQTIK